MLASYFSPQYLWEKYPDCKPWAYVCGGQRGYCPNLMLSDEGVFSFYPMLSPCCPSFKQDSQILALYLELLDLPLALLSSLNC